MKRRVRRAAGALLVALLAGAATAGPREDVVDLYRKFAAAQNAHDLGAVRALLLDSPDFLWVSDGRPVWGVEATIARMAGFQEAKVWRVEPDLAGSRAVPLDENAAFLHLPLTLVIGSDAKPDRLRFLVGLVGRRTAAGWRIAALFTTADKTGP